MLTPVKSPLSPPTATSPRRIPLPSSLPALPCTMISPPRIPTRAPRGAAPRRWPGSPLTTMVPPAISAPTQSPACPATRISPPLIAAPRCMPALPSTTTRPRVMPAPIIFTRARSPTMRSSPSASPSTRKKSPSVACWLPWSTPTAATWAAVLPSSRSGTSASASTGTSGVVCKVSVRLTSGSPSLACQQAAQRDLVLSQTAAVVAGRDPDEPRPRRRRKPAPHGLLDCRQVEAVDHDLEHARDLLRHLGRSGDRAQRRTVGVVGGRDDRLVARAHLAAAAHDAVRKRQDHSRNLPHGVDSSLRRGERRRHVRAEEQQVATADGGLDAEAILDHELTVHDRHAPEAAPVQQLARLVAVAEVAQRPADHHGVLGLQGVVAGGGRASHHALPDPLDQPLAEAVRGGREQEHRHARTAVRSLGGRHR